MFIPTRWIVVDPGIWARSSLPYPSSSCLNIRYIYMVFRMCMGIISYISHKQCSEQFMRRPRTQDDERVLTTMLVCQSSRIPITVGSRKQDAPWLSWFSKPLQIVHTRVTPCKARESFLCHEGGILKLIQHYSKTKSSVGHHMLQFQHTISSGKNHLVMKRRIVFTRQRCCACFWGSAFIRAQPFAISGPLLPQVLCHSLAQLGLSSERFWAPQ